MSSTKTEIEIPTFNLQAHHAKVQVPESFDMKDLARKYSAFPLKIVQQNGQKRLLLAMVNPLDQRAIADVEFRSGVNVIPVRADKLDVQWLIQTHYYGRRLSPVATIDESNISHDVFAQLEMTTDEQNRPEWATDGLQAYDTANITEQEKIK